MKSFDSPSPGRHALGLCAVFLLVLGAAGSARAICDVIPQAKGTFRGALGSTDRPFAIPGDSVEFSLDVAGCDAASPGLAATDVMTVVFTPPAGTANAVVVAPDAATCTNFVDANLAACAATLGGGATATCVAGALQLSGAALEVRFPNTDADVAGPSDLLTYAGPATLVVTDRAATLPCGVPAAGGCAACLADPGSCSDAANLHACVDQLYEDDGTCTESVGQLRSDFSHWTALPIANNYEEMCTDAGICVGGTPEVRFTVDAAGNLLMPMDWSGVRVPGELPIPRIVNGSTDLDAFTSMPGTPVRLPGASFLSSYSPQGQRVPPLFEPLADSAGDARMFGSVDAERGVVRIARRSQLLLECSGGDFPGAPCGEDAQCPNGGSCVQATCQGGSNAGGNCASDAQCPGGECGPGLFDFSDRFESGVGPVRVASYTATAENPVPLDGLVETDDLFMFVRSEVLEGVDLNGDGDSVDRTVVTLRDRITGASQSIGDLASEGLKTESVRVFPSRRPAVAVEDDVLALVQTETCLGDGASCDTPVPHPLLATALRVFRLDASGTPLDLLAGAEPADPAPAVGRRALAVSDGLVFYRAAEAASSGTKIEQLPPIPSLPGGAEAVPMSADGRFLAYAIQTSESRIYVLDRDPDGNGAFAMGGSTSLEVSIDDTGTPGSDCFPFPPCAGPPQVDITPDGRYVVFSSEFSDLVGGDTNDARDAFVHDRDADDDGLFDDEGDGYDPGEVTTTLVSLSPSETQFASGIFFPGISGDGRHASFEGCDGMGCFIYVRDRDTDGDGIFDEVGAAQTVAFTGQGASARFSGDGRFLALEDVGTNSRTQIFVHDRDHDEDGVFDEGGAGETSVVTVSLSPTGDEGNEFSTSPSISADGRFVSFRSLASNLRPGDTNEEEDLFLHDRDADGNGVFDEPGGTATLLVDADSVIPGAAAITRDGRYLGYSDDLGAVGVPRVRVYDARVGITEAVVDTSVFSLSSGVGLSDGARLASFVQLGGNLQVSGIDMTNPGAADLSGDGDNDDTLLLVLDARNAAPGAGVPVALTPAEQVAVAEGNAVWLGPEDGNVWLYRNRVSVAVDLGIFAEAVALSPTWIAALVSEAREGADLNGDGDQDDLVVHVNALATASAFTWVNTGQAADAVGVAGQWVAFTTLELGQEGAPGCGAPCDLNGDFDNGDRVIRVYDAGAVALLPFVDPAASPLAPPAVEDFIIAGDVLTFRMSEADQGATVLNGDADAADFVLGAVDLPTGTLLNAEYAAIRCPLEACDPTVPYRINGQTVSFLTLESDQSGPGPGLGIGCETTGTPGECDLNGNGNATDLILQHFNVAEALAAGAAAAGACVRPIASASTGICTDDGSGCADDSQCLAGVCYLPPGGCIREIVGPVVCDFDAMPCAAGQFCEPDPLNPGFGTCHSNDGPCNDTSDCTMGGAVCQDGATDISTIATPLAGGRDGSQVAVTAGRCMDGGVQDGTCTIDDDCTGNAVCVSSLAQAGDADRDADLVPDSIDNCPATANTDQVDLDTDGVGDACDLQTCGNDVQEYAEECDDPSPNCGPDCLYIGPGACNDGVDNDGDGEIDYAGGTGDPGCTSAVDVSEREASLLCDNGLDDDGDGLVDFSPLVGGAPTLRTDPGCRDPVRNLENPQCDDDINNDGDGNVDWDGGPLGGTPDSRCVGKAFRNAEKKTGCGLGWELGLVLPALLLLRRRRPGRVRPIR